MKRGWLVVALLASLGLNLGLVGMQIARARAAAAWSGERGDPGGPDPGARLADRLRLEGGDRERFLRLQRRLAEAVREERGQIGRLRHELRAELIAPRPDRQRIDDLLAGVAGHQEALDRAFADNVLESRQQLSGRALEAYLRFVERFAQPGPPGPREALRDRGEGARGPRRGPPPPGEGPDRPGPQAPPGSPGERP
jgi:hypothetical protein